jgi:hypothetical protein
MVKSPWSKDSFLAELNPKLPEASPLLLFS